MTSTENSHTLQPDRRPIPPPPCWRPDEKGGPFGSGVLRECDGGLGLALWLGLRRVWTWCEAAPRRRRKLGTADTADRRDHWQSAKSAAPELSPPLCTLELLARTPGDVSPAQLSGACDAIHRWADDQGLLDTAVHFAEAAARAWPESAERACSAGRICRRAALPQRSAAWFFRAYPLALANGDREQAVRALLGYGALMKDLGRLSEARILFRRAARRAARTGRRRQAAEAYHDLMALSAEGGDLQEVQAYAGRALDLYPLHSPRLPYLAHDFAFVLMRRRLYTVAYPLLEAFLRVVPGRNLLPGLGTFAWAAAGCGLPNRFEDAERRVLQILAEDEEYAAAACLHLAEGARLLQRWPRAASHARAALAAAQRRQDAALEREAHELSAAIATRVRVPPADEGLGPEIHAIIRQFRVRLRKVAPPQPAETRGQAPHAPPARSAAG
jgi:tetratricopeptide (TPR) repeat protein